jgi:hypothetical protein
VSPALGDGSSVSIAARSQREIVVPDDTAGTALASKFCLLQFGTMGAGVANPKMRSMAT